MKKAEWRAVYAPRGDMLEKRVRQTLMQLEDKPTHARPKRMVWLAAALVLVLLCVVKLVLVDIRYDNVLLRAAGFFVGGILCFGISLVYNLVDKWMGRRENAKN